MKKNLLILVALIFISSGSFSQNVVNSGFENWTAGNPDSWLTDNFTGAMSVTQSVDAYSGNLAAQGSVITYLSTTMAPVLYSSGAYGFPISQSYQTLEFWYKFSSTSGDLLDVQLLVYDATNTAMGVGIQLLGNAGTYTHVAMPINYLNGNTPASCYINFTITDTASGTVEPGSYFLVDDVTLTNNPSGIQEPVSGVDFLSAFPNPAKGSVTLNYSLSKPSPVHVSIFDVAGKKVVGTSVFNSAGVQHQLIDLSMVDAGIYICKIQTDEGIETRLIGVTR